MNDLRRQKHALAEGHLQRRITVAVFLMGLSVALWAFPAAALAIDMPRGLSNFCVNFASSVSILVFLAGLFYGYQKRWNDRLRDVEAEAERERQEFRRSVDELRDLVTALGGALSERIERVAVSVTQNQWNAYSDGMQDGMGKVADEEVTKRLPGGASIIPMPQHPGWANQRGPRNGHEVDAANVFRRSR